MWPVIAIAAAVGGYLFGRRERKPSEPSGGGRTEGARTPTATQREAIRAADRLDRYPDGSAGWLQGGRIMERGISTARALMDSELVEVLVMKREQLEEEWREREADSVSGEPPTGTTDNRDHAERAARRLHNYLRAANINGMGTVEETSDGWLRLRATLERPTADDLVVVRRVPQIDGLDVHLVITPAGYRVEGKATVAAVQARGTPAAPVAPMLARQHAPEVEQAITEARTLAAIESLEHVGVMQRGILAALEAGDEVAADALRAHEAELMAAASTTEGYPQG